MRDKIIKWAGGSMLFAFISSNFAFADETVDTLSLVRELQEQMKHMQQTISQQQDEIQALKQARVSIAPQKSEAVVAAPAPAATAMTDADFTSMLDNTTGGATKWLKDLKFSGDLRMRYEGLHYHSGSANETDDRNRFRYRLRYGFEKKMNSDMKIGFSMASGEQSSGANSDPNSTNTTFDNNFNFKPIFIERAYATYTPRYLSNLGPLTKTEITGGKMTNAFEKGSSDLVWDRDVKPEGVYEKADFTLIDTPDFGLNVHATLGQFILDEDATVGGDANLFAYQIGVTPSFQLMDMPVSWLHAISFYDFDHYAINNNFTAPVSLARTNPDVDGISTALDAGSFKVIEYYSELGFTILNSLPAGLYLDLAGNPADRANGSSGTTLDAKFGNDFAWALGAKLGGVKKKGDWEIGYQYKYIGADAVPAAFNDNEFGDGFTGKRGSVFKLGYGLTDTIIFNGAAFFVENLNPGTASIIDQQQRRFQVDLVWKF